SYHACFRVSSTTFFATSSVVIFFLLYLHQIYLLKNCSSRSRMLFQPSLWRSRDSSLGNCSCLKSSSVPPSRSDNSTVTRLVRSSHASSSSHFQVKTIFFPGTSSRYSPNALISSPSGLVRSQRYLPPTRTSAVRLRVRTPSGPHHSFSWV